MRIAGSYVLLLFLPEAQVIHVGRIGAITFSAGHYAYVGSAMNGLTQRISRHLRRKKRIHWHIDYLLQENRVNTVISCETETRIECEIARVISSKFESIPGFGSSDCHCSGHLFYSDREMALEIRQLIDSMGVKNREQGVTLPAGTKGI